jgi:hypothetical protein
MISDQIAQSWPWLNAFGACSPGRRSERKGHLALD